MARLGQSQQITAHAHHQEDRQAALRLVAPHPAMDRLGECLLRAPSSDTCPQGQALEIPKMALRAVLRAICMHGPHRTEPKATAQTSRARPPSPRARRDEELKPQISMT